jgi:phenol 2-monooxygenase (NADPH)
MEGEQTDFVWGVIDIVPDTNLPDVRNKTIIHSTNGACMIIPREGDKIRLYIQLGDSAAVDDGRGRVDKNSMTPEKLLDVARKSMHPYYFKDPKEFEWWTIYRSKTIILSV